MLYKIYECEELAKKDGGTYKKLVLKAEGQENSEPRVTLWDNHPQYAEAKTGGTINGTLEKKDSGTPIPEHPGKNYINRTLLAEGTEVKETSDVSTRLYHLEKWAQTQGFSFKNPPEPKSSESEHNSDGSLPPNFDEQPF